MDHREFLAEMSAQTKATLSETENAPGLWHLCGHLALIAVGGTLIALRIPFWPLLLPVQGVSIVFLFTLEHECTHRTPFRNEALNEGAGRFAGFLILLPFEWFRYFHLAHHRHTNIDGKDPELAGPRPQTRTEWLWYVSGLPFWWGNLQLLGRLVAGREAAAYLPPGAVPRMEREARLMVLLYGFAAATLLWSPVLLWVWVAPVLLGQPFLRLYLLAEHGDCPQIANMFENTRTTFTTSVVRFLAWNMPYHAEHHVMPSVPFHKLPMLHRHMRDQLQETADGYVAFNRAYLARRRQAR